MKYFLTIVLLAISLSVVYAYEPSNIEMYVVTTNTTTFTTIGVSGAKYFYLYNPGAYDIDLASSTSSPAAKRFTVKAASYLPFPVNYNGSLYAIATDSNSVSLEALIAR